MKSEFVTASGDRVLLKHREKSADYEGGIVYGKIVSKSLFAHVFWDKDGIAIGVPGLTNNELLKFFDLKDFSEEDFLSIPMSDEEEI